MQLYLRDMQIYFFKMSDEKQRGKYRRYTNDDLMRAVEAVRKGASKNRAAKDFGVPITTIKDRIAGRISLKTTTSGPQPVLSNEEEKVLVKWILDMGNAAFPVTALKIRLEVKKIIDKDGRITPFTNNLPGMFSDHTSLWCYIFVFVTSC